SIDLCQSLVPGVVHGTALYAGQELGIITKAGGFGDPDLFARLASQLSVAQALPG
ncbi:MAG: Nucleotide-binding C-terminal domain, partial [Ramlibacter sp.]|nr:Nucleotide-binding C-terminal domain [Ramlibacter sp.]